MTIEAPTKYPRYADLFDLQTDCWQIAEDHGFHDNPATTFGDRIALIHAEASEALEAHRLPDRELNETWYADKGKPEGVPSELADVVIRVFDLAEICGIDLGAAIEMKMQFNRSRPYRHGNKRI